MDRVTELLEGWRQLADGHRDPYGKPGVRKWNALVDRLTALAEAAVGVPAEVARLREIAETDPDHHVRREARFWINPPVPRPPEREHLDRWLHHPLVNLAHVEPEPGAVLLADRYTHQDSLTWYGGSAPQVAQLSLSGSPGGFEPWTLLPHDGVLQFFRDGRVHHLPDPEDDDLDLERPPDSTAATVISVWTFPGISPEGHQRMLYSVFSNWGMDEEFGPIHPLPTILGTERDGDHRRLLHLPGLMDFWIPEKTMDLSQTYARRR